METAIEINREADAMEQSAHSKRTERVREQVWEKGLDGLFERQQVQSLSWDYVSVGAGGH